MEIRLAATTDDAGADEVRRDELDMVIVSRFGVAHPRAAPGLREWRLVSDSLRVCVPLDHPLASAPGCAMSRLWDEPWVVSPGTTLGRFTLGLCATAGFEPRVVATVSDVSTAIGLVGLGWGVTIAPELTPAAGGAQFVRVPLEGQTIERHTVVIVRDGDHLSPRISATISAMLAISSQIAGDG
jgi:DNA-binding transcriptional LysR family regulator